MATKTIRFTPFSRVSPTLDFALKNNLNVLFSGEHGVGKSSIIIETLKRHGLKYRYFSASTMDPYVDFVGIPMQVENEQGDEVIRCIRPEHISDDVEVFVFDEFNRSHSKIRNAVMELIQSKSINGRKFPNLKVVWAAINPSDHENSYDVEDLDPAQADRFHMHIHLPYEADESYFKREHGATGEAAVQWWKLLERENKKVISPRRLEYGVSAYNEGATADLIGVLFDGVVNNVVNSFLEELGKVSIIAILQRLTKNRSQQDENEVRSTLHDLVSTISGRNSLERIYKLESEKHPQFMWTIVHTPLEFVKSIMSAEFQRNEPFNYDMLMATIKKHDPVHPVLLEKTAEILGRSKETRDMSDKEYFDFLRQHFDERNVGAIQHEITNSLRFVRYVNNRLPNDLSFLGLNEFRNFILERGYGKWASKGPSKTYVATDKSYSGVSLMQMVLSPESLAEIIEYPTVDAKTRKRAIPVLLILSQLMCITRWMDSSTERDNLYRIGKMIHSLKYRIRQETLVDIAAEFRSCSVAAKTYFMANKSDGSAWACLLPEFHNIPQQLLSPMTESLDKAYTNFYPKGVGGKTWESVSDEFQPIRRVIV